MLKKGKKKETAKKAKQRQENIERSTSLKNQELHREIKFGELTIKRHEQRWRAMLMGIAVPQMRQELESIWHHFERVIDTKDFEISLHMDELNHAEEQYHRCVRSHIDNIDNIIVLCHDQIGTLWADSEDMIYKLYKAATTERGGVVDVCMENENHLKTMLYMLERSKKDTIKYMRGEYLSRGEVEISKLNDISTKFQDELKQRFETMWNSARIMLKKYIDAFAARKVEYNKLCISDDEMQKAIRKLWEQVHQSLDTIKILNSNFEQLQVSQNRKIFDLMQEMTYFDGVSKVAKQRLHAERKVDNDNLTFLSVLCNEIMQYLEGYEKKGDKLLSLAAISRKFETAQEKTMLFPTYEEFIPKKRHVMSIDRTSVSSAAYGKGRRRIVFRDYDEDEKKHAKKQDPQADSEAMYLPEMKLFWLRVAAAEASKYKINEEIVLLKEENKQLKLQIFDYCECLNCPKSQQLKDLYVSSKFVK